MAEASVKSYQILRTAVRCSSKCESCSVKSDKILALQKCIRFCLFLKSYQILRTAVRCSSKCESYSVKSDKILALQKHIRFCLPGVGSMGKSMEFKGRPWFLHASHASLAFPCYAKAWKSMGSMGIFFRLHQQSMD